MNLDYISIIIFPILLRIKIRYRGKQIHIWGAMIDNHWGWFWIHLLTTILLKNPHIYEGLRNE